MLVHAVLAPILQLKRSVGLIIANEMKHHRTGEMVVLSNRMDGYSVLGLGYLETSESRADGYVYSISSSFQKPLGFCVFY